MAVAPATATVVTGGPIRPGVYSNAPLQPNLWGTPGLPADAIAHHGDSVIGQTVDQLGREARLDVDGQPLANVLGHIATDAVQGRITAQQLPENLRTLADRLPLSSPARHLIETAADDLDAPPRDPIPLPAGTPGFMATLMDDLSKIPAARRTGDEFGYTENEMDALADIVRQFAGQKITTTWLDMVNQKIFHLSEMRHESDLDRYDVLRAIRKAQAAIKEIKEAKQQGLPIDGLLHPSRADLPALATRPSGLPTDRKPAAFDFEDLADRLTGKSEAEILATIQDLNASELTRLARKFPGPSLMVPGVLKTSDRTQGLQLPDGLSLEEKRQWLAQKLAQRRFNWR